MACCSSCAGGKPTGCAGKTGANLGQPRLIRRNGQALGFIGPLLSIVSAVNTARALGAPGGCGADYMHLVQAAGERSKASPYGVPGIWCNEEDALAWWQTVQNVKRQVVTAAMTLQPKDRPKQLAGWLSILSQLPEPAALMAFGQGGCGAAVANYIAAIEQGACMLEIVAAAGAAPLVPNVGPVPESPSAQLGGAISSLAIGAGVLFLAYALLKDRA